jgi:NAD+ diphosphatase
MHKESLYKRYIPSSQLNQYKLEPGYWFAFCSDSLLVKADEGVFPIPYINNLLELNLIPIRIQYLGTLDGRNCYSAELPSQSIVPAGYLFSDLRSLYPRIDEDIFLLAGRALQIVSWDQSHQYCGRCGHSTETLEGEMAKTCPVCKFISYPRISPVTSVAVLKDDKILLIRHAGLRGRMRTIVAGFLEPGETLEECVKREVLEEVGLKVKNIKYFGSQPWPFPNSLMIGFTAEYESGEIKVDGKEVTEAAWYDVTNISEIPPKMSLSREIIDWYITSHSSRV